MQAKMGRCVIRFAGHSGRHGATMAPTRPPLPSCNRQASWSRVEPLLDIGVPFGRERDREEDRGEDVLTWMDCWQKRSVSTHRHRLDLSPLCAPRLASASLWGHQTGSICDFGHIETIEDVFVMQREWILALSFLCAQMGTALSGAALT